MFRNQINRLVIDGRRLTTERTGVGRYLENLLNGWSASESSFPEIVIVIQDPAGASRITLNASMSVKIVGIGWPGLLWEWFGLGRVLREGDVLFAPTNLIPRRWSGPTVLVIFDTLLEAVPHGFSNVVRWRFRGRYRSAARRASCIIVPSHSTARDVMRYYGVDPTRIRMIYPSIGTDFRPRSEKDRLVVKARQSIGVGDEPYFLFVGKRSKRRNVPAILLGFEKFRATHPSYHLVFVGPDSGELSTPTGVIDAGHVADKVLLGLLAGAVACLYPSDYEGFGLPIVEAMACGCPVVTLRSSALVESGGDAAYFLDRADADSLNHAMIDLTRNGQLRADLVAKGLLQAKSFQNLGFADAVRSTIEAVAGAGPDRSALLGYRP